MSLDQTFGKVREEILQLRHILFIAAFLLCALRAIVCLAIEVPFMQSNGPIMKP